MSNVPSRETFESMYARKPPWDIGRPQPVFVEVADRVTGAVLDAGCGTGENALFFAERGHPVLGIDYLEGPIQEARRKAEERGLDAEFVPMDALTLGDARPAVRQRDRQRAVPRLLRRGPGPLRRRAGPCHQAGRPALPALLQRRGARHPGAEAGLAGGDSGGVCGRLGRGGDPARRGSRSGPTWRASRSARAGRRRGSRWSGGRICPDRS